MNKYFPQNLILIALIVLSAKPAYADAGLPMLVLVMPAMIVSIVPIVIIEACCIRRLLNIPFTRAIKVMGIANLESTFIGIPITWTLWCLVEIIIFAYSGIGPKLSAVPHFIYYTMLLTVGAAWLGTTDSQAYWMVPVASLVLLVPFFYISWLIERRRAKKLLQECVPEMVYRATLKANIYSYGLLGVIVIGWLIISIMGKGNS